MRMRNIYSFLLFLALTIAHSSISRADTQLTGKIRIPRNTGFNGWVEMTPNRSGIDSITGAAILPVPVTFGINNGVIEPNAHVVGNDTISPKGTLYQAAFYDTQGQLRLRAMYYVSGTTFDLGSAVPTSITAQGINFQDLLGFRTLGAINVMGTEFSGAPGSQRWTVDGTCDAGSYWIAPVAGAVNSWRICNNGVMGNLSNSLQPMVSKWFVANVTHASSPYYVSASDSIVYCDATAGAVTINLFGATGSGREITVKKIDSGGNSCLVVANLGDTIEGNATYTVAMPNMTISVDDRVSGKWAMLQGELAGIPLCTGATAGPSTTMSITWSSTPVPCWQFGVTTFTNQLAADVAMTTANTAYDGPTLTLGGGTWLLTSTVSLYSGANASRFTCKIWDGTNVSTSTQDDNSNSTSSSVSLSAVVIPLGTTTYKTTCVNTSGGGTMKAATVSNAAGNTASSLIAVKIQ